MGIASDRGRGGWSEWGGASEEGRGKGVQLCVGRKLTSLTGGRIESPYLFTFRVFLNFLNSSSWLFRDAARPVITVLLDFSPEGAAWWGTSNSSEKQNHF